MPEDQLGLDSDKFSTNHKTALFFRSIPAVVKAEVRQADECPHGILVLDLPNIWAFLFSACLK